MLVEHSRLANAPRTLDRVRIERYQLIIVRLDSMSFAEATTCIFLLRILKLPVRPAILIIAENEAQYRAARSTGLRDATWLLASKLTSVTMQSALDEIAQNELATSEFSLGAVSPIPGYQIREPIAGTYNATVYRAFSEKMGQDVALKIGELESQNKGTCASVKLRDEYLVLRKLAGERVAHVYEYGEVEDVGFIAMEYFRRGSIDNAFGHEARDTTRVDIMLQVAEALAHVHGEGILHLDLKPNNVLIRDDGSPVLIDFGISKRILVARFEEKQSLSMGSPYFMSPEQMRGGRLDIRSDIYSFGAVWYRIFTGQVPFAGRTIEQLDAGRRQGEVPNMGEALRHYQPIIDKTLAYEPADRFQSTEELIDAIDALRTEATGCYRAIDFDLADFGADLESDQSSVAPALFAAATR
jgi:serine/threonine protein kinase